MSDPDSGMEGGTAACAQLRAELARAREAAHVAEELFQTVLGQSIDVIYRRNLKTDRYDYLSPAVESMTGFTVEEFASMGFAEIMRHIHPDNHGVVERRMRAFEQSRDGTPIEGFFEYRLRRKDGLYRWLSDSGAMVFGPDGAPLYHVGVARDVTDRRRLEEELRRHSETLEKAVADRTARLRHLASELALAEQRERKRLSDFLHDDLQQVLVAAKYAAERLALTHPEGGMHAEAQKLVDHVTEAVARVRAFSNGLATPLLYVVGLVPALRELAGQMLGLYGLRVAVEFGDMADIQEEAVRAHLYHAVRELLFNVAKHSGTDTARVSGAKAAGRVEVTVADAGKGFDPAKVLDGDVACGGCGLFSIREHILGLGGDLRIDSAPGRGTNVTLSVPVAHALEPAPRATPPAGRRRGREERTHAAAAGARTRVLVADDHDLVRTGVVSLLSQHQQLEVVGEAANGREAVALARQLRPDVVVMDIRMPEMDGIEATRLILADAPETLVIGITAFGDAGFRSAMLAAGAADLLEKEDAGTKLPRRIAECLAGRSGRTSSEQWTVNSNR